MTDKSTLAVATIAATLLACGTAHASCKQSDTEGAWNVYTMNSIGEITNCRISVDARGKITSSKCSYWSGGSQVAATTIRGDISIQNSTDCTFVGTLNVGGLPHRVRQLTLMSDKKAANGFGTYSNGQFSINLTKF